MTSKTHQPCPDCGSSDALQINEDGSTKCYSCDKFTPSKKEKPVTTHSLEDILSLKSMELRDRGISKEVMEEYGVRVECSQETGEPVVHYYPYYKEGQLVGFKKRIVDGKLFSTIGDMKKAELFGSNTTHGNKYLIITEGEIDAMSIKEMLRSSGKDYNVVSLPSGASGRGIQDNLDFIESFETVVLCFDNDKPGLKAVDQAIGLIKPGKVKVCTLPEKDANEMLKQGRSKEFLVALGRARVQRPDGLVRGKDTWQALMEKPDIASVPFPEHWNVLNDMTYGMRLGELDTWTSGSGSGKTQIFRELQYHLLKTTEETIGVISLEESLVDSVEALMALDMNKRIQLPDVKYTEEEYRKAWENTQGTDRFVFYDHFGSIEDDSLISKIRQLARVEGCKYIFLDHLSIVVSEFAAEGGERERIDTVMSKLKSLTQELNIWLGLIVHLRKTGGGTSFEEGAMPTLDDLRGSGSIKQLSNSVYATARNQQADNEVERNVSQLAVLKCRFTGRTGKADRLLYNSETGRLEDFDEDFLIENGEQDDF